MSRWIHEEDKESGTRFVLGVQGRRTLCCVGVNPSTARPDRLDPTSRSVVRLAEAHGFDGWRLFNLYGQRTTDPRGLHEARDEGLHRRNLACLERHLREVREQEMKGTSSAERSEAGEPVVWAAWGTLIEIRPWLDRCLVDVARVVRECGGRWVAMGEATRAGHPRHPLFLKRETPMAQFDIDVYVAQRQTASCRETPTQHEAKTER